LLFPMTVDHQLIILVQYNAVHAIITNMSIISTLGLLPSGCPQSLGVQPVSAINLPDYARVPRDLQPTNLELQQRTHSSQSWSNDTIPVPQLRDNIIGLAHCIDVYDLAHDLGKGVYDGYDDPERRGLVVWGDRPWSTHGWEVSDGFMRKWGFLLKGCTELVLSTNRWREFRGEDGLAGNVA
ncbi:uncharacterized protein B0I36DRAFT_258072, partial [Microdochium trichocladiopsis]